MEWLLNFTTAPSERAGILSHVVDEPEQQIIGLCDGSWKVPGAFVGHDDLRLVLVGLVERRRNAQDQEKRNQGSRIQVIRERLGHIGIQACRS